MALDPKVLSELNSIHDKLNSEGKLVSRSLLAGYYDIFRRMFGPEKLKRLDGEVLLETMHDQSSESKDSLVYWLEYKDDDELPGVFGSIAGGSALKFGLYRRKETGAWMTGSPAKQVELSTDEAVAYARKHRDQLVRGAELLERLPDNGTDEDYRALQEAMDRLAPDVSNTAWGHKYFSMLFPEKLDDYHAVNYQRYHLMKLLQIPPEGTGRYIYAGRYVAIAKELDITMNNLIRILNYRNGRPHTYWRIGTSDGTKARNRWELMRDGGFVAIGWRDLGHLSGYEYSGNGHDSIKAMMAEKYYPGSPAAAGRKGTEVFRFAKVIPEGGLILACDGGTVLGIGKVTGPYYYYQQEDDFPHRRPVEWLSLEEWRMPKTEGLQTSVFEVRDAENIVEAEKKVLYREPVTVKAVKKPEAARLEGIPARIQAVLERKGQVILYDPPGTGKTYWAEIAACELAARSRFGLTWSELSDEQKPDCGMRQSGCARFIPPTATRTFWKVTGRKQAGTR